MSSSVAHAACDHIVQSLHGHIVFLKDQGAISDESLRMYVNAALHWFTSVSEKILSGILNELWKLDLQALTAESTAAAQTPVHIPAQNRASIDTDLQMLDLPSKKDNEALTSSDPHHAEQSGNGSDSDYDLDHESDLKQQERLLQQEQQLDHQNGDIVTGELDNLVAASATDDQDLEDNEHEVAVLEGADDIDDDDEEEQETVEVYRERSLSAVSTPKPQLPPLFVSDSNNAETTSALASAPTERALSASSSPSGSASKAPNADLATAADIATGPAIAAVLASVPIGHASSEPQSHAVHLDAQPPASTAASSALASSDELNSPSVSSSADTAQFKQSEHSSTTSAAAPADIPSAHSLPSSNLEHSEQRNTSVSTAHPADHEHHHQQYVPALAATTTAPANNSAVYAAVYGHTYHPSTVADTPQHQADAPTVYNPPISQTPVSHAPVVYQPQVFSPPQHQQHQQPSHLAHQSASATPLQGGNMSIADILDEMDHDEPKDHVKERSFPHHVHDASATTMVSTEGKGSVTSVESGKLSEHHPPTPPPKDNAPLTYQPPTTVDVSSQSATEASVPALATPTPTTFTNADPIMPQPLALPVQAYQLYKPKPYQPQSKPSTKIRPQTQQAQQTPTPAEQAPTGQTQVEPQEHEQEQQRQQYEQYQQQQQQQQQHSAVVSPAVTAPAAKESGHAEPIPTSAVQDQSSRRLSSLSNSSFNGAAFRPETIGAATAASAAIQAARRSTTSSPLQSHGAKNEGASNPYQIPQEQQQPMVQQQEHRQQVPGSPVSEAGSRLSTLSTISEVRNLQVIARAQAMFDFAGEDEGDLPFKVGEIINVIEYLNADWWRGILRKDVGIFPTAYVQELKPPTSGKYPTISVSVRQSVLIPSPTDIVQPEQEAEPSANHLQQQASFRASYQPSLAEDHAASSAPATPQSAAPISNPGNAPVQSTAAAPMNANNGGAPTPAGGHTPEGAVQGSGSFPAPPPPPANSQSPPSVYTYFPGSGNQPPISPPPSMRNASQRIGFGVGQGGIPSQQAPGLGSPVTMPGYSQGPPMQQQQQQPMSSLSPQQQRFSQQYQAGQSGAPGQQQQYQQYQQYQQQQQQQQQGLQQQSPTASYGSQGPYQQQNSLSEASGVPGAVGTSQMTTKQMQEAAKSKSKKKFGSKW
ncbi:hypothetical protein KVV02_008360 [Mortierella alpina]|uniref:SH3 domain-containing protein n=1 Tax=Mortierella alpina TaxID=64518 RepID=A0A9P7ZZ93_MORAP|nr:hypothetical protein KVV02_008360 [Mortierella alpina]